MTGRFSRRGAMRVGGALAAALWGGPLRAGGAARPSRPLVMGHRGASALRPEHTLAAYAKAIEDGADFIEPDLVPTKDGVLVARHEPNITETTDVAARDEFAARRTTKVIDGVSEDGWFTTDFTFAELKTLHAKERLGAMRTQSAGYDGQFRLLSFDEVLDFTAAESAARSRKIGLIPEIKHSTYFAAQGFAMEKLLFDSLMASGFARRAPVIVQSFEIANLVALRELLGEMAGVQLMQLIDDPAARPADVAAAGGSVTYAEMLTNEGLAGIANYADWVAPQLRSYIPLGPDGKLGEPTTLAADAHRAGLLAGCYTFRPENRFLAADFKDDKGDDARNPEGSLAEIKRYLAEGLDGFFTDDPALGREVVDAG
ncbi:glycerophosphodiester phosphodiesterase family protein [Novosphingobium sp. Chol11]|uniref:glycerophosphodiester phosphodiesterase family protein n=1 Tax=Novosphingobium sp. Chol11 TaxID=1385763 RepID=UPI0025EABCFB|nr:glycerophosphodiester phosphodiesterase family protein [Novosphingobium sp. Chol11]